LTKERGKKEKKNKMHESGGDWGPSEECGASFGERMRSTCA